MNGCKRTFNFRNPVSFDHRRNVKFGSVMSAFAAAALNRAIRFPVGFPRCVGRNAPTGRINNLKTG